MSDQAPARHALRYDALLLLAAAIWGFAFVASGPAWSTSARFVFNGIRFALGALVLVPILLHGRRTAALPPSGPPRSGRAPKRPLLRGGLAAGLVLFARGLAAAGWPRSTTAGKAASSRLVRPARSASGRALLRQRIGFYNVAAACSPPAAYLLSMSGALRHRQRRLPRPRRRVRLAVHVLVIARFAVRVDPPGSPSPSSPSARA